MFCFFMSPDSEPPVFINCSASPIVVGRYASASLYAPSAEDNSKLVVEITTLPKYFLPNQPIARDMNVTFVARDAENLTSSCQVVVLVKGLSILLSCSALKII